MSIITICPICKNEKGSESRNCIKCGYDFIFQLTNVQINSIIKKINILRRIRNIYNSPQNLNKERLKNSLDMDDTTFSEKLEEWREHYLFEIDGGYLKMNENVFENFIRGLENYYDIELNIRQDEELQKEVYKVYKYKNRLSH